MGAQGGRRAAGQDGRFGRGAGVYDRYFGDPKVGPNPCLAPLTEPPFYGLRVYAGCLGTKGGLRTDASGRVLHVSGEPIAGLFACGNAAESLMGPGYAGAGASLGPGCTFGFLAGKAVAAEPVGTGRP